MYIDRIFGLTKVQVLGALREVYSDDFHDSHSFPGTIRVNKSRRMRHLVCTTLRDDNVNKILIQKQEKKKRLTRPKLRVKVNFKTARKQSGK
jgi:hypothetical protein